MSHNLCTLVTAFVVTLSLSSAALRVFDSCDAVGESCPELSKCSFRGCDGRICICEEGTLPDKDSARCIQGTPLDSRCNASSVCLGTPFSSCQDGVCSCLDSYYKGTFNGRQTCFPKIVEGGPVQLSACPAGDDERCPYDLVCTNGTCTCPPDTRPATKPEVAAAPYLYYLCRPVSFQLDKKVDTNGPLCRTNTTNPVTSRTNMTTTRSTSETPTTAPTTASTTARAPTTEQTTTRTSPTSASTTTRATTTEQTTTRTSPTTASTTTRATTTEQTTTRTSPTTASTTTRATTTEQTTTRTSPTTASTSTRATTTEQTTTRTLPTTTSTTTRASTTKQRTTTTPSTTTRATTNAKTTTTTAQTTASTTKRATTEQKTTTTAKTTASTTTRATTAEPIITTTAPTTASITTRATATEQTSTTTAPTTTSAMSTSNITVPVGGYCSLNPCPAHAECLEDSCSNKRCRCELGYAASPDMQECWKLSALGAPCSQGYICQGPFTKCSDGGRCECQDDYEPSDTGRWCRLKDTWSISFPLIGEQCGGGFFSDCYMFFEQECVDGRCRCNDGLRPVDEMDRHAMFPSIRQCRASSYLKGERDKALCENQLSSSLEADVYARAKAKIHKFQGAVIGGSVGFVALVGVLVGLFVLIRWKRKGRRRRNILDSSSTASTDRQSSRYSYKIPRPFASFEGRREYDSDQISYPGHIVESSDHPQDVLSGTNRHESTTASGDATNSSRTDGANIADDSF